MAIPALALAAVAAVASIANGFSQRNMMKAKTKGAELDAKYANLRAQQVAGNDMEQMNNVIAQVNSIRIGRGLNLDSATGRAIRADRREKGVNMKNTNYLNALSGRDQLRRSAAEFKSVGKMNVISGFGQAAGTLASAAG